jgi:hypothetical protein
VENWVIAGLVLLGAAFLTKPKSGSTTESLIHPSDSEIAEVADYALAHETDAQMLRSLAAAMRVLPMGTSLDPTAWNRRRAALEARAVHLDVLSGEWRKTLVTSSPTSIKAPRTL